MKQDNIKDNLLEIAKQEFLEKGYINASMRNIAQKADCTTGTLYNRFKSKQDMYDHLVANSASKLVEYFTEVQEDFAKLDPLVKIETMYSYTTDKLSEMIDLIYKDFDDFKLIICKSKGSKYEDYIEKIIEIQTKHTYKFMNELSKLGIQNKEITDEFIHIINTGMFNAVTEVIQHDFDINAAKQFVNKIFAFFNAGLQAILFQEDKYIKNKHSI